MAVRLLIDTVVCLTLAKWETVTGPDGGYLRRHNQTFVGLRRQIGAACVCGPVVIQRDRSMRPKLPHVPDP